MSMLAVSTGISILALIGLAVGLMVALIVLHLFSSVVRPALEIDGYASDILDAGVGIATNVDGVDGLVRTQELTSAVPGLAVAYLEQVKPKLAEES